MGSYYHMEETTQITVLTNLVKPNSTNLLLDFFVNRQIQQGNLEYQILPFLSHSTTRHILCGAVSSSFNVCWCGAQSQMTLIIASAGKNGKHLFQQGSYSASYFFVANLITISTWSWQFFFIYAFPISFAHIFSFNITTVLHAGSAGLITTASHWDYTIVYR